jgi:hypothetical protein
MCQKATTVPGRSARSDPGSFLLIPARRLQDKGQEDAVHSAVRLSILVAVVGGQGSADKGPGS